MIMKDSQDKRVQLNVEYEDIVNRYNVQHFFLFSNWKEIENQLDEFVEVMIKELLQPEKNGLKKPPGA